MTPEAEKKIAEIHERPGASFERAIAAREMWEWASELVCDACGDDLCHGRLASTCTGKGIGERLPITRAEFLRRKEGK